MTQKSSRSQFDAQLLRPAEPGDGDAWAFVVLPKAASEKLPRRGRVTVEGQINDQYFQMLLEPDGQKSHWLKINEQLLKKAGASIGDVVTFTLIAVEQEPEPQIPPDLNQALQARAEALATWQDTTTIARLDWIHWITSAKQAKTRSKRIIDACDMLSSGKKRVCCFDPSGYYSKVFSAPRAADQD
ncbi:YdeI/OmpD-associated family protein [Pseudomonas sp. RL_15y_Pfl2_60]|uniref:YdeI/OmpD-associated family protein n=1 Tax=Pseudomonas sp. RL_15y_Pfl2_60 TaxID=3088709 RepID=UPI0030DB2790